jgi:Na+/H+ antiporter NhaD/arsenite permease-like protein
MYNKTHEPTASKEIVIYLQSDEIIITWIIHYNFLNSKKLYLARGSLRIINDKIRKTILAIFSTALLIVIGILTQEWAFTSIDIGIDWNVIFLLLSMMVITNIMKPIDCFESLTIKSIKVGKINPFMIMLLSS